jgi:hypothetical protein
MSTRLLVVLSTCIQNHKYTFPQVYKHTKLQTVKTTNPQTCLFTKPHTVLPTCGFTVKPESRFPRLTVNGLTCQYEVLNNRFMVKTTLSNQILLSGSLSELINNPNATFLIREKSTTVGRIAQCGA